MPGLVFGDPHFTTLDNTTYTFNGLGEYTIVTIDDGAFQMQARTVRTSGRGLGTVFSAAAAKEQGTATVEARINQIGNVVVCFLVCKWSTERTLDFEVRDSKRCFC